MAVWGGPQFWITTVDNNIYFQPSQIWSITPIQFREFECGCNDLSHISTVEHHICRTGMFQSFGTPKFPTAKQKKTLISTLGGERPGHERSNMFAIEFQPEWASNDWLNVSVPPSISFKLPKRPAMANRRAKGRQEFWVASDQKNLLKSPWSTNLLGVLIVDGSSRPYVGLKDLEILDCFSLWETFCLIHWVAQVTICIYINICLHINKLYVSSECMLEWANLHTGSGKCSTKTCQEIMPPPNPKRSPKETSCGNDSRPKGASKKNWMHSTAHDSQWFGCSQWFVSHHLRETLPQPSEKITRRRQNMWWHMLGVYGVYPNFIY